MAEASKESGEKYRRVFSEYDPYLLDTVSSAASSCNLNFFLKKEQMQALSEYVKGKDVVVNLPTGYGKSLICSLCTPVCDNLRNVKSKKERSMLLLISPLSALMDGQRLSLTQLGLSSLKLTPNVSEADIRLIFLSSVNGLCATFSSTALMFLVTFSPLDAANTSPRLATGTDCSES